jgi:hypothetical protein
MRQGREDPSHYLTVPALTGTIEMTIYTPHALAVKPPPNEATSMTTAKTYTALQKLDTLDT